MAQDVSEILDTSNKTSTKQETELFSEKQKRMFAVFKKTLKIDNGKTSVRAHINDQNAQKLFKELSTYAPTFKASLDYIILYYFSKTWGCQLEELNAYLHTTLAGTSQNV